MAPHTARVGAAAAAVLALGAAWSTFVFGSSQAGYTAACALAAALATAFALLRSRWLVVLVVAEVALLGTEASGELAAGTPHLGGLRIVDMTLLAAGTGLAAAELRRRGRRGIRVAIRSACRSPAAWIWSALGVWVATLWFLNGAPTDAIARTDVRVAAIAVAAWLVAALAVRNGPRSLALALTAVVAAAAVKALGIYLSGVWTIGVNDRLQASSDVADGVERVILVGGDTLLVLAPVIAVAAYAACRSTLTRALVASSGALALGAVLISGTRTSLLVAGALLVLALAGWRSGLSGSLSRNWRTAGLAMSIVVVALVGTVIVGSSDRFLEADRPGVGLNFRRDEVKSFLRQPARDILLGEGIGGRFPGRSPRGQPVVTGWSHALPVWIALKAGVIGLAGFLALLLVGWRALRRALRDAGEEAAAGMRLGALFVVGILTMSLTLGRLSLPEGAVLVALGAALAIGRQQERAG